MLRITVLLCVSAAAFGFMMGPSAMMKKFAYMNIMSNCLGEEVVSEWMMKMKDAVASCKGEDVSMLDMPSFQKHLAELRLRGMMPKYVPVPYPVPMSGQLSQFMGQTNKLPGYLSRNKRQMPDGEMGEMQEKMMTKISNITCALRKLNYLDEDNQPMHETIMGEIQALEIDDMLKADLLEAMAMCQDFSKCLPVENAKHPLMKELGTAMGFMKCGCMKKAMVCMKHGMRKYAEEEGAEGMGDMMEDMDLESLMMEGMDF